jgi:hypothetical protein
MTNDVARYQETLRVNIEERPLRGWQEKTAPRMVLGRDRCSRTARRARLSEGWLLKWMQESRRGACVRRRRIQSNGKITNRCSCPPGCLLERHHAVAARAGAGLSFGAATELYVMHAGGDIPSGWNVFGQLSTAERMTKRKARSRWKSAAAVLIYP